MSSGEYTGPRPSPAKAWAPWVVVTAAAAAIGNVIVCGLNLLERHYQQQRLSANPPSVDRIRHTLDAIRAVSTFDVVAATAFLVCGVVWQTKRRTRGRLKRGGEFAVEPALRKVIPIVYWILWLALAASIVATTSATSTSHTGMTINEVVTFRSYLAMGAAARTVGWVCFVVLVIRATQMQTEREAGVLVGPDG